MARASTSRPPNGQTKPRPRRQPPTEFPDHEDEFFDEDDLAALVGVNRRAFHPKDEE